MRWLLIKVFQITAQLLLLLVLAGAGYVVYRLNIDSPETFDDPKVAFKYGSTGGDKNFGLPLSVWNVLPVMFSEYLPEGRKGMGWGAFGFLSESGEMLDKQGVQTPRPVGTSMRNFQGVKRIFINCAACHAGKLRMGPDGEAKIYLGMPGNTMDLQAFQGFLTNVAVDERFTGAHIVAEITKRNLEPSLINRLALKFIGIGQIRDQLLTVRSRLRFVHQQTAYGPGRFDTFTPAKALLNWPFDKLSEDELIGVVDFPSIWLQGGERRSMKLHWDGNNTSMEERNRSAAFATGANPPILDRPYLKQIETWLLGLEPPAFPGPIDQSLLATGKSIYADNCANCHGNSGRDFTAPCAGKDEPCVGEVMDIEIIGTDRARFDNYTYDLAVNQNQLYATFGDERFRHFRKTIGYAMAPLDGIWLRAPYLHNGSVPSMAQLLTPPDQRTKAFWRGTTTYNADAMGFVWKTEDLIEDDWTQAFCHLTDGTELAYCAAKPPKNNGMCDQGVCPGNGNQGHDYGTDLSALQKKALIEYLKTF